MVRIRLRKTGSRGQPSYRLVAAPQEAPRDGRFLENLGYYNPRTEPATIAVHEDRVYHWLKNGAQPSDSALKVLQIAGTMGRFERLKQGEAVETLLAEATAAQAPAPSSAVAEKAGGRSKGKKQKKAK